MGGCHLSQWGLLGGVLGVEPCPRSRFGGEHRLALEGKQSKYLVCIVRACGIKYAEYAEYAEHTEHTVYADYAEDCVHTP